MKRKPKACRKAIDQICETLGENLASKRCAALRKHMEDCRDCTSYLKTLRRIIDLYRSYPVPTISAKAKKKLKKALKTATG